MANDSGGTGIPASIEAAWGVRKRPAKGPKPALSLEKIVAAGVGVAETEGLDAVSMARVASEVGAATMALYRYVGAKEELLELMVDAASGSPPDLSGYGWRRGLTEWGVALLHIYLSRPWVLQVPLMRPPSTPNQIAWLEEGLRSLAGTRLKPEEKAALILLISGHARSTAQVLSQFAAAAAAAGSTPDQVMEGYQRLLDKVVDPTRLPEVRKLVDSGIFGQADEPDDDFRFGLDRILDGIAALIRTRT